MLMDIGTYDSLDKSLETKIRIKHVDDYNERKVLKRPQRSCMAKDELKNCAVRECAFKAQAKATTNMATTTLKKA